MIYFKKTFGQNLKLLRKAKNLIQEQLAELVNLNQRQLTRIENEISFVSSDVIESLFNSSSRKELKMLIDGMDLLE